MKPVVDMKIVWNDDDPPPCPWCGQTQSRRLPRTEDSQETRFFECSKCKRQFLISWQLTPGAAD